MTATAGNIEWAEQFVSSRKVGVDAAILRGNELWVLFDSPDRQRSVAIFQFARVDEAIPKGGILEYQVGDGIVWTGGIYFIYAWRIEDIPMRDYDQECKQALLDAERKLEAFTDRADRKTKVLEQLRWSYLAGRSDFSSD